MENKIVTRERNSLSMRQKRFLIAYRDTISVKEAAKIAGTNSRHVRTWLSRPHTLFSKTFNTISKEVEHDERFSKAAGLERLNRCIEMAFEEGDYMAVAKIQGTINQMIEGNIAIQKSLEKKETEVTVKVIDFTQRKELHRNNVIDITPEEIE